MLMRLRIDLINECANVVDNVIQSLMFQCQYKIVSLSRKLRDCKTNARR